MQSMIPKFSDRQVWANSVDTHQIAPEIGITLFVIPSACFGHISPAMVKPHWLDFTVFPVCFFR